MFFFYLTIFAWSPECHVLLKSPNPMSEILCNVFIAAFLSFQYIALHVMCIAARPLAASSAWLRNRMYDEWERMGAGQA